MRNTVLEGGEEGKLQREEFSQTDKADLRDFLSSLKPAVVSLADLALRRRRQEDQLSSGTSKQPGQ